VPLDGIDVKVSFGLKIEKAHLLARAFVLKLIFLYPFCFFEENKSRH